MSNGLGAGFGFLLLLGVLIVVAVLLGVTTLGALGLRHYGRRVPRAVHALVILLLAAAMAVGGFGVAALFDEAWLAAVLLVAIVWLPLGVVAARARWSGAPWPAVGVTAAMAWWLPFLASAALLFAISVSGTIPVEPATVLGAVVAAGGALLVGEALPPAVVGGTRETVE